MERYTTSVEVELGNRAASKLTGAVAQDRRWVQNSSVYRIYISRVVRGNVLGAYEFGFRMVSGFSVFFESVGHLCNFKSLKFWSAWHGLHVVIT